MKYGNRTAMVMKYRLPAMGRDNLLYQMESQNVGCVGVGAGVREVLQNRFWVSRPVVPDFQHKLSVYNFCRYPNVTAGGIVADTVVQEIIHGSCQQFFVCF